MPRQEIGDFGSSYPTPEFLVAENIRGGNISGEVIELFGTGGVIRTQDFETGVTGWAIYADGSAEFNNVTVRGAIEAGVGSTVDWSYIANVTIDNADITDLSFDKITAATNTASLTIGSGGLIESSNYVAATSGFRINGSGSAEFNNVTVRGQVIASSGSFTGAITASSGSITGNLSITGSFTANLSGDILTLGPIGGGTFMSVDVGNTFDASFGVAVNNLFIRGASNDSDYGQITFINNGGIELDAGANLTHNVTITQGDLVMSLGRVEIVDGSVSSPGLKFSGDGNTGIYRAGTDDMRLVAGGTSVAQVVSTRFGPGSDNSKTLGGSGLRWQEIWMVGAIGSVNNVSRDASGRLTVASSSRRFKNTIAGSDLGLSFIEGLRPVTFNWNEDEKISTPFPHRGDIGLIAEEVAEAPGADLFVLLDEEDLPLSVRYELLTVPLINAVKELSARVRELELSAK